MMFSIAMLYLSPLEEANLHSQHYNTIRCRCYECMIPELILYSVLTHKSPAEVPIFTV